MVPLVASWIYELPLYKHTSFLEPCEMLGDSCEFTLFSILVFVRFLHTSLRLLRRHWADLRSEWSGMKVLCSKHPHWSVWFLFLFTCPRFHDSKHWHSWRLGDLFPWIVAPSGRRWNPIFPQVCSWQFPYHFFSSPGPRNVQCPCENLFAYVLNVFWIWETVLFVSYSCPFDVVEHWHEDHSGSSEEFPMKQVLGIYSTRTQSVLHQLQVILCKNVTVEIVVTWFSHLRDLLLNGLTSPPDTERSLSKHVLLLLSTWSLDHEAM